MGGWQAAHDLCFTLKETWVILGILIQQGLYLSPFLWLITHLYFFSRHPGWGGQRAQAPELRASVQGWTEWYRQKDTGCLHSVVPAWFHSHILNWPQPLWKAQSIRTLWDVGASEFVQAVWQMRRRAQRRCVADTKQVKDGAGVTVTWPSSGFMREWQPILHPLRQSMKNYMVAIF